jgi:hypothetical protein
MKIYSTTNVTHTYQSNLSNQPFKIGGCQPDKASASSQLQGFEPIGVILNRLPLVSPQKPIARAIELKSPCSGCGGTTGKIGAGRKPGEVSLHCAGCKRFLRWIAASELKSSSNHTLL